MAARRSNISSPDLISVEDTGTVVIRHARSEDIHAMTRLLGELFALEADFKADPARQRKGLALMLDGCGKHRCLLVAETDGSVVGMCSAQMLVSTAEGGPVALIEDMVVHKGFRNQGIGRLLLGTIETWAKAHDARRLQLLADRTNFTALDFYHKIGWRPTRLICLRRKWKTTS